MARRLLHWAAVLAALCAIGGGIALLLELPGVRNDVDAFTNAPPCIDQVVRDGPPTCFVYVPAVVTGTHTTTTWYGSEHAFVDFRFGQGQEGSSEFNDTNVFYSLNPRQRINLKVWGHEVFALTTADAILRIPDNPRNGRPVQFDGGLSLLGVGLAILLVLAPARLVRRPSASGWNLALDTARATVWPWKYSATRGLVRRCLDSRATRWAFTALAIAEGLDVLTSVWGRHSGLYEANPLAAALVQAIGPIGFSLLKVPAVIGLLVVAARVRSVYAATLLWTVTLVTAIVAITNVWAS